MLSILTKFFIYKNISEQTNIISSKIYNYIVGISYIMIWLHCINNKEQLHNKIIKIS